MSAVVCVWVVVVVMMVTTTTMMMMKEKKGSRRRKRRRRKRRCQQKTMRMPQTPHNIMTVYTRRLLQPWTRRKAFLYAANR